MGVSPLKDMSAKTFTQIWSHEYLFSWLNCWKFTFIGVDALSVCVTFVFRSFQQLQWESAAPWWWHRKRRHTRLRSKTQTSVGAATSIWTERRALPHTPVKHHYSYKHPEKRSSFKCNFFSLRLWWGCFLWAATSSRWLLRVRERREDKEKLSRRGRRRRSWWRRRGKGLCDVSAREEEAASTNPVRSDQVGSKALSYKCWIPILELTSHSAEVWKSENK